MNAA
jgi:D-amino-acid dehydrogenase